MCKVQQRLIVRLSEQYFCDVVEVNPCSYMKIPEDTDLGKKKVTSVPFEAVILAGWNVSV